MAKKKNEKVSPFVPVEEQPYQVPGNWCWTRCRTITDLFNGDRGVNYPSKKDYVQHGIPFINAGTIKDGKIDYSLANYITNDKYESLRAGKIQKNDILYCLRGSLGKTAIIRDECIGAISSSLCILRVKSNINREYFFWLLQSDCIQMQQNNVDNGTAQPNLSASSVLNYSIPLPPMVEQQRIVDRIEGLFAKLDEAKEKAQEALESFELRKSAMFCKAFSGVLTERWRVQRSCVNQFKMLPLEEVCNLRSGTTIPVEEELQVGTIPYVKVADMNLPENQTYIVTSSRFVNSCRETQEIPRGSTIFPKRGGAILTNKKRIVDVEKIIIDLNTMAIIPKKDVVSSKYIFYWMQSIDLRELNNGSSVPQINNKDMLKLSVPITMLDEQEEIVKILDNFFAKETEAKEKVEATLETIETMKKAILAKAFRGELGTNNPEDESAEELLKRTLL